MIRYYAYYSCGGYKDMYLGNSSDTVKYSYFLPLLAVWKAGSKPEFEEKLKQTEHLQKIEVISKDNNFGFPAQAKTLFSHGGYKAIYLTLSNGDTCFCVRDIKNGVKDEENRDVPFNILMIASGMDDIKRLDSFVLFHLTKIEDLYKTLAQLFSYDPTVNGIRFDLALINKIIEEVTLSPKELLHHLNQVNFLFVDSISRNMPAFKELGLSIEQVDLVVDNNGKYSGSIKYLEEKPVNLEPESRENPEIIESEEIKNDSPEREEVLEIPSNNNNLQPDSDDVKETISQILVSLNDIRQHLSQTDHQIKKQSENIFEHIIKILRNQQSQENHQRIDGERNSNAISIPQGNLLIIGIAFLVGFLLGALIF